MKTGLELRTLVEECIDVESDELRDVLKSGTKPERALALEAVARTHIRKALETYAELALLEDYGNQATLSILDKIAPLSDIVEPYLDTVKRIGIRAAQAGNFEPAMTYLQHVVNLAITFSQRRDARSRRLMRFIQDAEIDRSIESMAARFSPPDAPVPMQGRPRLAITCSAIQDEDGPTVLIVKRAHQFRRFGWDVDIVSTEMAQSEQSRQLATLRADGFSFFTIAGGSYEQRIHSLVNHFQHRPAHAISWTTSAVDNLGKLGACIGLAPVQSWDNRSAEPFVGKFDLVYQGVSPEQEIKTNFPGKSRFFGSAVAMAEEIDAAEPFSRAELGVPEDAVLLGTFGRMEKANTAIWLDAITTALRAEKHAWLVLAGRDGLSAIQEMMRRFNEAGVGERVRYLGPRQSDAPRLVKSIDIYCDTYPWPGGQSLLDAMQAARPVVAMRSARDTNFDPSGVGAHSFMSEAVLDGILDLAPAGDSDAYAALIRRYIGNAKLREADGARVREKAVKDCNMAEGTRRYSDALLELVRAKVNGVPEVGV